MTEMSGVDGRITLVPWSLPMKSEPPLCLLSDGGQSDCVSAIFQLYTALQRCPIIGLFSFTNDPLPVDIKEAVAISIDLEVISARRRNSDDPLALYPGNRRQRIPIKTDTLNHIGFLERVVCGRFKVATRYAGLGGGQRRSRRQNPNGKDFDRKRPISRRVRVITGNSHFIVARNKPTFRSPEFYDDARYAPP